MPILKRALPAIAALWLSILLAQCAGMLLTHGWWDEPGHGAGARSWFFLREAQVGALVAIALGFAAGALAAPTVPRAVRRGGIALLGALLVWLLFVSWGQYSLFGDFLGVETVRMMGAELSQLVLHARAFAVGPLFIGVPAAIALTVAAGWGLDRATGLELGARARPLAAVLIGATLAVSLGSAVLGPPLRREMVPQGVVMGDARAAGFLRATQHSGPLSYLRDDLLNTLHGPIPPLLRAPEVYERPPLVPLADYLAGARATANHQSVVVLVVESLRPDVFGAFGGLTGVMPTLDAIAVDALRFRDAYSMASHSNYADTSIASSQYPLRARGVHYFPEHPGYPRVLPQDVLAGLGYRCASFSSQNEDWGGMHNFDSSPAFERDVHAGNFAGVLREEKEEGFNPAYAAQFEAYDEGMLDAEHAGKIDDAITVDLAREWLAGVPATTPVYLQMNLQNSHLPYYLPPSFPRRFFTETGAPLAALEQGRVSELNLKQMQEAYLDTLAYIDAQVARLVADLKAQGRWEHTVFVVTGDTSTSFNSLGVSTSDGRVVRILGNGAMLLEEVVKVPLFMREPGVAPRDVAQRVQHIDLMPGVFDALGLPPHPGMQGVVPTAPPPPEGRPAFLTAQTPGAMQYSVLLGDWKLTYDGQLQEYLLENLRGAPLTDEAVARVLPRLKLELSAWAGEQIAYYENPEDWSRHYAPRRR